MKRLLINSSAVIATTLSTMALPAMAQGNDTGSLIKPVAEGDQTTIISTIETVITWLFSLAGALAVVYLIWGGIQYITGGAKGAEAAKGTIINAVIGIVVIVLAYVIVKAVVGILGGSGIGSGV